MSDSYDFANKLARNSECLNAAVGIAKSYASVGNVSAAELTELIEEIYKKLQELAKAGD